jgi:hypothetical protein
MRFLKGALDTSHKPTQNHGLTQEITWLIVTSIFEVLHILLHVKAWESTAKANFVQYNAAKIQAELDKEKTLVDLMVKLETR